MSGPIVPAGRVLLLREQGDTRLPLKDGVGKARAAQCQQVDTEKVTCRLLAGSRKVIFCEAGSGLASTPSTLTWRRQAKGFTFPWTLPLPPYYIGKCAETRGPVEFWDDVESRSRLSASSITRCLGNRHRARDSVFQHVIEETRPDGRTWASVRDSLRRTVAPAELADHCFQLSLWLKRT
jgi:hypothetical protein